MLLAPLAVALVGLLLERGVIRFFYTDPVVAMLGTYAIGLVIRESVRGLIGGLYHSVPEPVAGSFSLGAIAVSKWRGIIILVTAAVMAGAWLLLTRTRLGLADPRRAREPGARARLRPVHHAHLRADVHGRRGARRARRRSRGAASSRCSPTSACAS